MMTGSGDLTILALRAGVTDFVQKPFGRAELLSVLDQISMRKSPVATNESRGSGA
jgi:FixJ family two-component response regulator